ncbi:MAG: PQQ-binding-like beta-propeller repeat protein [Candidatus Coatesbacteria bacterium]|nr:PQQ-binding-like beta-propeller repeat protein [Candidatus Coatesbacteria bacterium]
MRNLLIIIILLSLASSLFSAPGDLIWKYQTAYSESSPCVSDGVVYVGAYHYLYAINCSDGTLKWSYKTVDYVYSSPCVSDGVVYLASAGVYEGSYLYALYCSNGTLKWRYPILYTVYSSPCVSD